MPFDDFIQFEYADTVDLHIGDCRIILQELPTGIFQSCITSPPYYGLRNYQVDGQIGLEQTPDEYVAQMVSVFREVHRVLRDDGTLWLNLGDCYANDSKWGGSSGGKHAAALHGHSGIGRGKRHTGMKPKDLIGIPWRVAFALQANGWWLRSAIVWHKENPIPESVKDRPTSSYEMVFLLAKSEHYVYDATAVAEPSVMRPQKRHTTRSDHPKGDSGRGAHMRPQGGTSYTSRNCRNVWTINTKSFSQAHFAVMPEELARRCLLAGTPEHGCCPACGAAWTRQTERVGLATVGWSPSCQCVMADPVPCRVLDPFGGAGTTGLVAAGLGRHATLIELKPDYGAIIRKRLGHFVIGEQI